MSRKCWLEQLCQDQIRLNQLVRQDPEHLSHLQESGLLVGRRPHRHSGRPETYQEREQSKQRRQDLYLLNVQLLEVAVIPI